MQHDVHNDHDHVHSESCGHTRIQHEGHVDYVHDGCLHSEHDAHYDEHAIAVSTANPGDCKQADCDCGHDGDCNHEQVRMETTSITCTPAGCTTAMAIMSTTTVP
jgi:hypothetical protein